MPPPGVCLNIVRDRQREDGQGTPSNPCNFNGQDFLVLRDYCLSNRVRFVDKTFPPVIESIGQELLTPEEMSRVVWKRPGNLHSDPHLIVAGLSRFDVCQGSVGNCWFLAALGSLTFQPDMLYQIIPQDQGFTQKYAGIFHFVFWRFGKWVDVVIDDKLPTLDGKYLFVYPRSKSEFWPSLLEKAYAKLCGSYSNMNSGLVAEALMDFTGGVNITFSLKEPVADLWQIMKRAESLKSLMACGTPQGKTPQNTMLPNGIVEGHAYTVTGVAKVQCDQQIVELVRMWNPWGKVEWNGQWSDGSPEWNYVDPAIRHALCNNREDGEFWMTMKDFKANYADLNICNTSPDFLNSGTTCMWAKSVHSGRWVKGTTAGGCFNNRETFWMNPQYRVTLTDSSTQEGLTTCNVVVSLIQEPTNRFRHQSVNKYIGFAIYKGINERLPAEFFMTEQIIVKSKSFVNSRSVTENFMLQSGEYLVVPSTYNQNEVASFVLTIYSKTKNYTEYVFYIFKLFHILKQCLSMYCSMKPLRFVMKAPFQLFNVKIVNIHFFTGRTNETGGFGLDSCKGIIAIMDLTTSGKLNADEFLRLWKRITIYQEIFHQKDVSRTGFLFLHELRSAIQARGIQLNDELLNLMALRYGDSSSRITLESYLCLMLRLECMASKFMFEN
ncbi:CAN1 protein, partial [Polyodon spathula]|nr:CAN1 protein [Polyodon spathula]